ncbi:MAG: hypothetical protein D6732_11305 [Methanobacteriota archaeon]|nr:MAG: hypothetical protein D6732_11305 [Euryarchaeota archaeon]
MLVFDLEFYVPPESRNQSRTSLIMNPTREGNIIIGGSFYQYTGKFDPAKINDFWIWQEDTFEPNSKKALLKSEKQTLTKIYNYIDQYAIKDQKRRDEHRKKKGYKNPAKRRITYSGIGIARTDLPILFIRSATHKIAPSTDLFEQYLSHHPFDLANALFGFVHQKPIMKPLRAEQIFKHFKIPYEKDSSKSVWEMFEKEEFQNIVERTHKEIQATIQVLQKVKELMSQDK